MLIMQKYLSSSLNSVVSLDLESSWAARSLEDALRQNTFDAKFQQKQIQEKEKKLLRLYENQQQKAFEKVSRGSAGSNTSMGSTGGGKVRQMFDERRQKAGVDKSYPLEPLKVSKTNSQKSSATVNRTKISSSKTVVKSTSQKSYVRNGKTIVNKQDEFNSVYINNNHDEDFILERLECDNLNKTYSKVTTDNLVEMINNHNLNDSLDNEEMPQLAIEEPGETLSVENVATNYGGKLSSENLTISTGRNKLLRPNNLGKTFRKETKPIINRSVKPVPQPQRISSSTLANSQPSKSASPLTSPVKSVSQTMQANRSKGNAAVQPSQSARAPCNTRPSAKQSAKSPVARDDLNECRYCNRRFAPDRLETHEAICGQTMKKKRRIYDATKHRVEGTELEQYVKRGKNLSSKPTKQAPKKDWRRTHEEFINAIRAAKTTQAHLAKGGKLSDLPPPPPSSNPDYVQCPHCGRKFNEPAAERHIPKCASYSFNKPKPGVKGKTGRI